MKKTLYKNSGGTMVESRVFYTINADPYNSDSVLSIEKRKTSSERERH
jgi:hypothetical protein